MSSAPTSLLNATLDFGPPVDVSPQVIGDNGQAGGSSAYPVTIAPSGEIELVQSDDGSLFLFLSFSPSFGLGGGAQPSSDDVTYIDWMTTSVMPVVCPSFSGMRFVPLSSNNVVDYSFTTGIDISGGIGVKGEYSDGKPGGEVSLDASFAYHSEQTSAYNMADVGVNAQAQGNGMNWPATAMQVYDEGQALHYDISDPHGSIHSVGSNNYRKPPDACFGTFQYATQGVWSVPAGNTSPIVFGVAFQARLIHGHKNIGQSWCYTSSTWICPAAKFFKVDPVAATVTVIQPTDPEYAVLPIVFDAELNGVLKTDGTYQRLA